MGEHELNGLLPNGLLPNESTSVIRVLDAERWSMAEERIAELIACIQPNQPSEERRNAVTEYVQRLIMKCFPCQVFTFGSVPLKTYLPDGDIDLTAFSKDQSLKESWAGQVRDMLESEEKNENAEFRVKEVQYIQAEVKIIKCLVENIVVDISFNQLGGLCTLCFLEEVDHLINQNHLFKRSIILIKAWCYYESRILGAHHGLISTYALETLVLYIFHVFNNSFAGPLEVLYRFLEFFSNFDWDNFCVSLWGPVPISSLPDVTAEPPRKDGGELLLSKLFLNACTYVYAVFPAGLENQGQPFSSKHFNVIDPLRVNNNLGRSVSKGNFYRIRSAFAFGAKRLARLLECPKDSIVFELNQFFMNTWERHGSGIRPDAPTSDLWQLRPSNQNPPLDNNQWNASTSVKTETYSKDEYPSVHELDTERDTFLGEITSQSNDFHTQGQKGHFNPKRVNEVQGRYLFARTRSSPELTDVYSENTSSRTRRGSNNNNNNNSSKAPAESGKPQMRKKNTTTSETTMSSTHSTTASSSSHHQMIDADSNSISGGGVYEEESGSGPTIIDDHESSMMMMGAHGMRQEDQDLVNLMASSSSSSSSSLHHHHHHHHHNFVARQIPLPVNLGPTGHLPVPISLASMGYAAAQRTAIAGMVPTNLPMIDPYWAANLQFHQGLISSPQFFPGIGLTQNVEDVGPSEMVARGGDDVEYWQQERDPGSNGEVHSDERQVSTSGSLLEAQGRVARGSVRDEYVNLVSDSEDRISSARFCSASQSGSVRTSSKTSSESSWDGSSARGGSKSARDKRGRKTGRSIITAVAPLNNNNNNVVYGGGKGKNVYEDMGPTTTEADEEESSRDWIEERSTTSSSGHGLLGSEVTLGADSAVPMGPMIVGRQRGPGPDGSGVVPFTFYPTGPPVPFLTMLHFPTDPDTSSSGAHESAPDSGQSQSFDPSDAPRDVKLSEEMKGGDILNSDFASHWQNLQFGRLCQGPRYPAAPVVGPSPIVVPPMYLQGRVPWDGPGRPTNMNLFSHLINYGPRLVPVQPMSSRPAGGAVYQQYVEELPRYRSGTGTYLPNPKASVRDRHPSGTRRNSYNNYDRTDHADREGNWNAAKARAAARNHTRQNQPEKSRVDRNETRVDRPWVRPEPLSSSYQAQNGPSPSSSSHGGAMAAYGMYQLPPGMNPGGLMSNGPSVVMLYPYDQNSGYVSPGDGLEFGSIGIGGGGVSDGGQTGDAGRVRGHFVEQRHHHHHHGSSTQHSSSPDQPSSPHFQRRI